MESFKLILKNGVARDDAAVNVESDVKVCQLPFSGQRPIKLRNQIQFLDLLKEDIKDDIKCAKVIYNRHGFKHWRGWQNRCKARPLPDISKCKMSSY